MKEVMEDFRNNELQMMQKIKEISSQKLKGNTDEQLKSVCNQVKSNFDVPNLLKSKNIENIKQRNDDRKNTLQVYNKDFKLMF